jgi:hypothetical protein
VFPVSGFSISRSLNQSPGPRAAAPVFVLLCYRFVFPVEAFVIASPALLKLDSGFEPWSRSRFFMFGLGFENLWSKNIGRGRSCQFSENLKKFSEIR